MAIFSIGLAQDLMVDRLIIKVRVKISRSGFATYICKRHRGISTNLLAKKWGIRIDKAKRTLQSTNHDNLISDLKPLTRRYRTDFLSQRLRWLNWRFYTDTLFEEDKSLVGNTCAHIFTDEEFAQIIPMRYKSESDTTLDRINLDVRVANEIFMDNTPEQTGYNT